MVEFWISKGEDRLRLPVNPPSMGISRGYIHKDVNVMALGGISFPQGKDLAKYSIASFFPEHYNPTYCEYVDFPTPFDCVAKLTAWMELGEPVRLTVTGTPINSLVTIRGFDTTPWEHGDNDITYSLNLVEYTTPTMVRTVFESAQSTSDTTADPPKQTTGAVNVGSGKTLTVRKTASTKAASVGKLKHGAAVTILTTASGWYKITSGSITGYVQAKYVTIPGTTASTATPKKAVVRKSRPVKKKQKGSTPAAIKANTKNNGRLTV